MERHSTFLTLSCSVSVNALVGTLNNEAVYKALQGYPLVRFLKLDDININQLLLVGCTAFEYNFLILPLMEIKRQIHGLCYACIPIAYRGRFLISVFERIC